MVVSIVRYTIRIVPKPFRYVSLNVSCMGVYRPIHLFVSRFFCVSRFLGVSNGFFSSLFGRNVVVWGLFSKKKNRTWLGCWRRRKIERERAVLREERNSKNDRERRKIEPVLQCWWRLDICIRANLIYMQCWKYWEHVFQWKTTWILSCF